MYDFSLLELFARDKHDKNRCEKTTKNKQDHSLIDFFGYNVNDRYMIILQHVCKRMKHKLSIADTRKKYCESPLIPTVPGPVISPRTFTKENAPLITPNPRPDTSIKIYLIY